MILDYFDECYLINLDRDRDKLAAATRRLAAQGIQFTRVQAIDGLELPVDHVPRRGHYCCAQSHAKIYRDALAAGHKAILIFEDDVLFRDDAASVLRNIVIPQLDQMPWDILYLGCRMFGIKQVGPHICKVGSGYHTHAYAVRCWCLPMLLAWTESTIWHDEGWFDGFNLPIAKLVVHPAIAVQADGWSDTNECHMVRARQYFQTRTDYRDFVANCDELAVATGRVQRRNLDNV